MNSHQFSLLCLVSLVTMQPSSRLAAQPSSPAQALAPLAYQELAPTAIEPQGWLRQRLQAMRASTTGHLGETYPKVRDHNSWLGGAGDGWEETPYWLDGALPLAHLLHDKALLAKMQRYIDWSLTHQRPSGYFGPLTKAEQQAGKLLDVRGETGEDWWPRMVMLKVLQQHYQASGDARVIPFLTKYFHYQHQYLRAKPLTDWGKAWGGDNPLIVYWLYRQTGAPFLLELGELLNQQTTPWTSYLGERTWVMEAAANHRKANFPLVLRIPGWCTEATLLLNGQPLRTAPGGQVVRLAREWHPHDQLTLRLPMTLRTSNWAHNSRAVERGPLVYALKMREQWSQGTTVEEGSYFEIKPLSPWNYGLPKAAIEAPQTAFRVVQRPAPAATTFLWNAEHAPIELTTIARRLPDWQLVSGVAHQPVILRDGVYKGAVATQEEAITLIPYGCSKLRVVAFSVIP
jgi:hypothetical protein